MGAFKQFAERRVTGLYVCAKYNLTTNGALVSWAVENLIPEPLSPEKYHSTVLYSRKDLKPQPILDKAKLPFLLKAKGFKLFDSSDPDIKALAVLLDAAPLERIHEQLIKAGGTHDFPDYTPHITVSYNAPRDMDLTKLSLPSFDFVVESFKVEPLDLNWK